MGGQDGVAWKAFRILGDVENKNIVTYIPEIIASSDSFPMIGHNVEAKLVRPTPVVSLNIKEYLPYNEREWQKHRYDMVNKFYSGMYPRHIKEYDKEYCTL